jgi:hypothetical protein
MNEIVTLKGTHNLGLRGYETMNFRITATESNISISDSEGNVLISFSPFFDGGSLWLSDFSSLILDVEHWSEGKEGKLKCQYKETLENTSSSGIKRWKEDSEKLHKIQEAYNILTEVTK